MWRTAGPFALVRYRTRNQGAGRAPFSDALVRCLGACLILSASLATRAFAADGTPQSFATRGAYLAKAADCAGCHTATRGGAPYATRGPSRPMTWRRLAASCTSNRFRWNGHE